MQAQYVVFTKRAFNAIVTETLARNPIETGGIFLGYMLDNGVWAVVETIPPGIRTVNQMAYFEYDTAFVNYLANVIAQQYKEPIQVLGLWHRHPGSFDMFSGIDDGTNRLFAIGNPEGCGAISALVNCDPRFRLSMYAVDSQARYTPVTWVVDNGDIIPDYLLALRFEDAENLPCPENNIVEMIKNKICHGVENTEEKKTDNSLPGFIGR